MTPVLIIRSPNRLNEKNLIIIFNTCYCFGPNVPIYAGILVIFTHFPTKFPVISNPQVQHAVFLQNNLPNAISGFSPFEKRTGLAPKTQPKKMKGVLFCRCSAKVYVSGKLEAKARDCVYLGKDPNTPGFLIRLLGGKKTGKEVRTAQVITFFPEDFPYTHSTIPIPDKIKPCVYASDSDQEEDGIKVEDGVELQQSESDFSEEDRDDGNESEEKSDDTVQSKYPKIRGAETNG